MIQLEPNLPYHELLSQATAYLASSPHLNVAGAEPPHRDMLRREVQWLMEHVLASTAPTSTSATSDIHPLQRLDDHGHHQFTGLLTQRWHGKPLAYVLGSAEFYNHTFVVNHHTLIPRPETEELIELIRQYYQSHHLTPPTTILDVGTGSGCIALSLARLYPEAQVIAVDISTTALTVAATNVQRHQLEAQVQLQVMDMRRAKDWQDLYQQSGTMDLIVANPPYVDYVKEQAYLSAECRHEPKVALDGGEDGLLFINSISQHASIMVRKDTGLLALEIGFQQAATVATRFSQPPWHSPTIHHDLCQKPRFLTSRRI